MSTKIVVNEALLNTLRDFRSRPRLPYWDIVDVYCDKERVARIANSFVDTLINYLAENPSSSWVRDQAQAALEEGKYEEGEGPEYLRMEIAEVLDLVEPFEVEG